MITTTSNCTESSASGAVRPAPRFASREVSRFVADVIRTAGGPQDVALDLEKLGYLGRDGPYSGRTVRTWRAGARTPGADLLFALARYYELSLDRYAFGDRPPGGLPQAAGDFEHERDRLREALTDLVVADEAYDTEVHVGRMRSQPGPSGQRRVSAMSRARDLLG